MSGKLKNDNLEPSAMCLLRLHLNIQMRFVFSVQVGRHRFNKREYPLHKVTVKLRRDEHEI